MCEFDSRKAMMDCRKKSWEGRNRFLEMKTGKNLEAKINKKSWGQGQDRKKKRKMGKSEMKL